ncbi:unnamed protein product [Linum tenue]|uniref:Uncharacterized protein n=1 Tax=Linum tenue TaxID=586396 RepID=A0AAV0Q7I7_9ROSI|nr:unnamed protein product [Linum tenue]
MNKEIPWDAPLQCKKLLLLSLSKEVAQQSFKNEETEQRVRVKPPSFLHFQRKEDTFPYLSLSTSSFSPAFRSSSSEQGKRSYISLSLSLKISHLSIPLKNRAMDQSKLEGVKSHGSLQIEVPIQRRVNISHKSQ